MKGIIDRFEGDYVVIEIDGQTQDIDKSVVNTTVKVGDVVVLIDSVWTTNTTETKNRDQAIKKLMDDVWEA